MTKSKPTATPAKASKSGNSPSMSANAAPRSSPRLQPQAAPAAKQQPQQQKKKAQKPESSEDEEEEDDDDDEELNVDAEVDELEDDEDEDEEMDEEDDEEEEEAPKPKSSKSAAVAPATTSKKSPSLSSTPAPAKKSPALTSTPAPAAAAADKKSKKRKAEEDEEDEEEQQAPPSKKIAAEGPVASSSSASSSSQIAIPKFNNPATFSFEPNAAAFSSLPLSEATMKAIKDMGFTNMTPVQAKCIPVALKGEDILGAAKTGSGKTLAFLIPAVELLVRSGFKPRNGTGVLVISPTRELALQIYGVTRELCKYHIFTHTMVMGGANMKPEQEKLTSGVNLLVGTPGRILDHLEHCSTWNYKSLVSLIIDEADRILEMGFEDQLRAIIKRLPPTPRQTLLFSATQTKNVKDIAILSMSGTPIYIGVDDSNQTSTAEGVEQGYVVCPSENRFLLLFTFLKRNLNKKVIVFFSTCAATQFYTELLNYIDIPVVELHGKQKQNKRTTTFFEFCNAQKGIMLCTDVAARGLDIPSVDWIIQFDPPEEPKEYIHRVGRTARGGGKKGRALLFLLPQELGFLKYLKEAKIPLNEYEFPSNKIARVQNQLEKVVSENYYLHKSAREAYRSYMQGYAQHTLKSCFNVAALDVLAVSKSFGFDAPPKVHLKISLKALKNTEKRQNQQQQGDFPSKHGFSEDNPYGKKQMSASEREDRDNDERARRAQAEVTKKPQQSRQWSR